MTKWIGDDVSVVVDGVDLSDHVHSVDTGDDEYAAVDVTGMGAEAHENVLAKAKTSQLTIEFFQDWDSGKVDATLRPLHGSNTAFTVVVKPTSASVSATNPSATLLALLPKYKGISAGAPGDAGLVQVDFVCGDSTGLVWATS